MPSKIHPGNPSIGTRDIDAGAITPALLKHVEEMGLRDLIIVEGRIERLSDVISHDATINSLREVIHRTIIRKIKSDLDDPADLSILLLGLLRP